MADDLRGILDAVARGELSPDKAETSLRSFHDDDLGFAKVDIHREARCGLPEAIFCQGKTVEQILPIAESLVKANGKLLATRISPEAAARLTDAIPDAIYHELARCVTVKRADIAVPPGEIAIACAGTSDLPVAEEARVVAEFLGNNVTTVTDVGVAGLHRLINRSESLKRANVVIVVAGMEGALASVVAGMVARPVIAVPTSVGYGASFEGLAPLLTMMNSCAAGVAVVNIDNGFGAACIASLINHTGFVKGSSEDEND
jgi:pyridinium-3,5-biscarboxylic acid mononucleotide synthase